MLRLPVDLYDPGPYADAGGFPILWFRSVAETVTGQTQYAITAFAMTRGNVTFTLVPPGMILHLIEARAIFLRTSGAGIIDAFGWAQYAGTTLSNFITFANDLTALSVSSWRTAAANNSAIAEALIIRDVTLVANETVAFYFQTASDTSSWNVQMFARGYLLPRGNVNRV